MRLRKVKTEKVKDIGTYDAKKTSYVPDNDGKIEVRYTPPIKIKLKP